MSDYVAAYQQRGNSALGAYQDKDRVVDIWSVVRSLASNFTGLRTIYPDFFEQIEGEGRPAEGPDDFIYWSRENYGFGLKSTLNVSHVMVRRAPGRCSWRRRSRSRQATTTTDRLDSLFAEATGGGSYLVYLNRSRFDLLRGGGSGVSPKPRPIGGEEGEA